jgi:hypothetical protein
MIINIEEDPRHAGQITRYHTWPVHRAQSVGEHTWQIQRIMLTIWPDCPRHLLVHCTVHDVGEMAGDLPWPAKRNDPVLKERMTVAELRQHRRMTARWGLPAPVKLSEMEQDFFKMCEYIEMWEFGLMEQSMGNRYGTIVATRMQIAAATLVGKMPPDIQQAARAYCDIREEQESETERTPTKDWVAGE